MDPLKGLDLRRGLDTLSANKADAASKLAKKPADAGEAEKAATDFEALLLHQMLNSMWSTIPKDSLLGDGNDQEIFRDMYTDAVAKDIAGKQSIGIKGVLLRELEKK